MKRRMIGGAVLVIALFASAALRSDQGKDQPKGDPHKSDLPGPVHQEMAKLAGEYTTTTKFKLGDGATPQESEGTSKFTTVLEGRFLREENSGTMLGMPFKGLRLWGYNNAGQQYESTWVYTGSTAQMRLTGTSKDDGKTVVYTATAAIGKDAKMSFRVETRVIDEDHFVVELAATNPDGSKGPTMETTYARKK